MTKYLFIITKSLKSQLVYRSTIVFSIISTLLGFAIQVSFWTALIGTGERSGTTLKDMILYIVINEIVLTLTSANIASMIETSVIDGSAAMNFMRPISYKWFLFNSIVGKNIYKVITNVVPMSLIAIIFIGIALPVSPIHFLLFSVSLIIGMLIMFELTYVVGLLAFWIQRCWFLRWYLNAGTAFLGGTIIPLWFYPDILNRISYFLPFRYISFEPINYFLGKTEISKAPLLISVGFIWLLLLYLLEKLMWSLAIKKFTVNGG